MERSRILLLILLAISLTFMACELWGENDNGEYENGCFSGVTGGDEDGYGGDGTDDDYYYSGGLDPALLGRWRYVENGSDYEILSFQNSGTFSEDIHMSGAFYPAVPGIYNVVGNELKLRFGTNLVRGSYSIQGNLLRFSANGVPKTYFKTQ